MLIVSVLLVLIPEVIFVVRNRNDEIFHICSQLYNGELATNRTLNLEFIEFISNRRSIIGHVSLNRSLMCWMKS
jgi:hypothetical protein